MSHLREIHDKMCTYKFPEEVFGELRGTEEEKLSVGGAFEFMMAEWHVTPDYIVNNWTEELLDLMVQKLAERKQKESEAMKSGTDKKVSDKALFNRMGKNVEVKRGN